MIRDWPRPNREGALPEQVEDWLAELSGPAHVFTPGRDRSRRRAWVTLIHGNEPSGVRALHAWLRGGAVPAVDLHSFIVSVEAARRDGPFRHRMLPGSRDLNRCFAAPFADAQGERARALLGALRSLAPEAIVDVHNTSQASPAYSVATRAEPEQRALTAWFAPLLIHTRLRLQSLMEAFEDEIPIVTIECGGAGTARADETALRGLHAFASAERALEIPRGAAQPRVLSHPLRVELRAGAELAFDSAPQSSADITLRSDLSRHCFEPVAADQRLGWVGDAGLQALRVRSEDGEHGAERLFVARAGELRARRPLELLMVTTDMAIARSDCLFYAVEHPETGAGEPQ